MKRGKVLSIIIPAYNEEKRIKQTIQCYSSFFDKIYFNSYEILVIVNGTTDNTVKVLEKLKQKIKVLKYLNYPSKIGKGGAIAKGITKAKGELVGFVDADLSTSPEMFNKLLLEMGQNTNLDCAIASRNLPSSNVSQRKNSRKIMTKGFNWYVNFLFNLGIKDTQCGAKVFKGSLVIELLPNLSISNMAFDVNFLVDLKKIGASIKEIPITWIDDYNSTITKPYKTSILMALSILRLKIVYSIPRWLYKYTFAPLFYVIWLILLSKDERLNRTIQN